MADVSNKCFAADGVTPTYTAPGLPIMVSAVDFNRVYSQFAALSANNQERAAGAVDLAQLLTDVKEAVQVSDNVGRSRGSNCYAMNGGAVVKIVNLMASIEHRFALLAATSTTPADEVRTASYEDAEAALAVACTAGGVIGPGQMQRALNSFLSTRTPPSGAAVKEGPSNRPFGWWHEQEGLCLAEIGSPADLNGWAALYTTQQPPTAEGQTNEQGRAAEGAVSAETQILTAERDSALAACERVARQAIAALVYHQDQTRPISQTIEAISNIRAWLAGLDTTQPPSASPVAVPELLKAAREVMVEFGTSSDGLQNLLQALKPFATQPALPDAGLDSQKGAS